MTIAVISNDLSIAKMLIEEYGANINGELEVGVFILLHVLG